MRRRGAFALVCACLAALLLLAGCGGRKTAFDGSRVTDETGFRMEYTVLNGEETAVLTLSAGEVLHVELAHEKGSVDVTVGIPGRDALWRGTQQADAAFDLPVPESGDYTIRVTGRGAAGRVSFLRGDGEGAAK